MNSPSRPQTAVIIPTYDEAANIEAIVTRLLGLYRDLDVLVIDDASPDGTGEIVRTMDAYGTRLFLLARPVKSGLGSAYRAGFAWATTRGYDYLVQMDADLSHPPERVGALLAALKTADVAIGSRYVVGGEVRDWSPGRRLISRAANVYVQLVLRLPVADATAGFRAFRRDVLEQIDIQATQSNGFCFQIETTWRASRTNATIVEIPITFTDRQLGHSKMSVAIAREAFTQVALWRIGHGSHVRT